jgi:hypothetical protein
MGHLLFSFTNNWILLNVRPGGNAKALRDWMVTQLMWADTYTQARQRAQERLRVLVKKAGLMGTWTHLERKAADVTPAVIEQMLRANRVSSASLSDCIIHCFSRSWCFVDFRFLDIKFSFSLR